MWSLLLVPGVMILVDYLKMPIDTLYFTKVGRPLLGIANTFRDVIHGTSNHCVKNYPGLFLLGCTSVKYVERLTRVSQPSDRRNTLVSDPGFERNDNINFIKFHTFHYLTI